MTRNADLLVMFVAVELVVLTLFPTDVIAFEDIGGAEIVFPDTKPADVTTRRAPQVRAWERRAPEPPRKRLVVDVEEPRGEKHVCAAPVFVVGDEARSKEAAELQARQHWMKQIRFDLGEKFIGLEFARDVFFQCNRSDFPCSSRP
jgi:hypothetical protein